MSFRSFILRVYRVTCCSTFLLKFYLLIFVLTYWKETGEVLAIFLTVLEQFGLRCTVFLGDMIHQVSLGRCWQIDTLTTKKVPADHLLVRSPKLLFLICLQHFFGINFSLRLRERSSLMYDYQVVLIWINWFVQ